MSGVRAEVLPPMRLDANCEPLSLEKVAEIARIAGEAGVRRVGTWDTVTPRSKTDIRQAHWPVALTRAAMELAGLGERALGTALGPSVTNFVTGTPPEIVRTLITLDTHLIPGRVWAGVGSGDSAARNIGLMPNNAAETIAGAIATKRLLVEGRTSWHGQDLSMAPAQNPIPVVVAAHGPRMLSAVAGALNHPTSSIDGLILGTGMSPDAIEFAEQTLQKDIRKLDISWNAAAFEVLDDPSKSEEGILFTIAQACHHYAIALGAKNTPPAGFFPEQFKKSVLALGKKYQIGSHGTLHADSVERQKLIEAVLKCDDDFVSYMKDRCLIVGTHEDVVKRLTGLYNLGVRCVSVAAFGDPARIERAAKAVAAFNAQNIAA